MDPFEARIYFSKQLSSLTPSKLAAQECSRFLIRNHDLQEDLHSVILETLSLVDLNIRINILQFLEELIELCSLESNQPYIKNIYRDIYLILTKVMPSSNTISQTKTSSSNNTRNNNDNNNKVDDKVDFRGLTNLNSVYPILCNISKNFKDLEKYKERFNSNLLTDKEFKSINDNKKFDDSNLYNLESNFLKIGELNNNMDVDIENNKNLNSLHQAWEFLIGKKLQSQYERRMIDKQFLGNNEIVTLTTSDSHPDSIDEDDDSGKVIKTAAAAIEAMGNLPNLTNQKQLPPQQQQAEPTALSSSASLASPQVLVLSHKQQLMRIEADRERQKRGKENLWVVERPDGKFSYNEFLNIYNRFDEFNKESDMNIINELNELYTTCKPFIAPVTSSTPSSASKERPPSYSKRPMPQYKRSKI
ncbi:hypothetical protein BVG19_g3056 [[Candida] boidinii]|nr:hypothetical protein BVG19_g3056 [[Candida] boidinii]OWB53021.1 hypothetical protein B5S27_g4607 [[Candida] boidinii]